VLERAERLWRRFKLELEKPLVVEGEAKPKKILNHRVNH
jgi:hypothetical protein